MSAVDDAKLRPVTVLTGFLGSGKTTTLSRLLKALEFAGTVAIINEFGEIGLDHLLIETTEERFALLDNGCICCTVRNDLVDTLLGLVARSEAGLLPDFRRVVIETTGLADPAPILHSLLAEPRLAQAYRIDGVLATVDAVNGLATLNAHREAVKQVAVADRLLITKTDLIEETALAPLLARLTALNPTATMIRSRDGDAPPDALVGVGLDRPRAAPGEVVNWFKWATGATERSGFRAEAHDVACEDPGCAHPSHGLRHGDGITTFSIVIDRPIAWGPFKQWLEYLAMLKGEDLLRFKGLIHIAERPDTPIVVHGVQHVFHPPSELSSWPSKERSTRLVFITRGIQRALIESTLSKFAAVDAAWMRRPAA
ncbi:GTP-binding protein [Bradyrhizobium sp. KB893862 SZCCT0404]|uniref:CobW family GTP-binding protein n=1 Tax=Bradyrhizobium sp. KB893862 SZCCT0404 TaxID=2807672 RepID=UPI001BA497EE|nr:GTP-binding protein [Bradyrhizobium sp. KB893862 SZCCT0404]MBR1177171.1 GTP-binding protein [Bradyrhizobium sp. KB893862 SZCCT0404]